MSGCCASYCYYVQCHRWWLTAASARTTAPHYFQVTVTAGATLNLKTLPSLQITRTCALRLPRSSTSTLIAFCKYGSRSGIVMPRQMRAGESFPGVIYIMILSTAGPACVQRGAPHPPSPPRAARLGASRALVDHSRGLTRVGHRGHTRMGS